MCCVTCRYSSPLCTKATMVSKRSGITSRRFMGQVVIVHTRGYSQILYLPASRPYSTGKFRLNYNETICIASPTRFSTIPISQVRNIDSPVVEWGQIAIVATVTVLSARFEYHVSVVLTNESDEPFVFSLFCVWF